MPKSFVKGGGGDSALDGNGYLSVTTSSGVATPNIYSASDTNTGFSLFGSDSVAFVAGGAAGVGFNVFEFNAGNAFQYSWNANASAFGGGTDTGLERVAAGVVGVTNGSTGTGYIQTAGESRVTANVTNATITPAAITGLSATVAAGRTYAGTITIHYNQSTAADGFRFDLDGGTATATDLRLSGTIADSTSHRFLGQTTALATDLTDTSTSGNALVKIEFTITVNVAGTIIPRFANEAASTGTGTIYRGSWMKLTDIA